MTEHERIAREIAQMCDGLHGEPDEETLKNITAALVTARVTALEEAAKLMESADGPEFCRMVEHMQDLCECKERAAAIRQLKEQP